MTCRKNPNQTYKLAQMKKNLQKARVLTYYVFLSFFSSLNAIFCSKKVTPAHFMHLMHVKVRLGDVILEIGPACVSFFMHSYYTMSCFILYISSCTLVQVGQKLEYILILSLVAVLVGHLKFTTIFLFQNRTPSCSVLGK